MKNKISILLFSLIFIITLLPSFGQTSFASVEVDASHAVEVLTGIGIIDTDIFPETPVTRGEMCHYAVKLLNIPPTVTSAVQFSDVTPETPYVQDIMSLNALGIIGGYSDGTFKPDNTVIFRDALKILVSALGYAPLAETSGGYFNGYYKYAVNVGLTDNLTSQGLEAEFSHDVAMMLLYNALDAEIFTQVSYGDNPQYRIDGERNVLTEILRIQRAEGVVSANSKSSLTEMSGTADGYVRIDGELFNAGKSEASGYLGYNVEFYYQTDKSKNENVILFADLSENNSFKLITSDNIAGYSGNELSYTDESDKIHKLTVSADTDILYNNKPISKFDKDFILIDNGTLELISNDGDSDIDVILAKEYRDIFIQAIDLDNGVIVDKYDSANVMYYDPDEVGESVLIYNHRGEISSADILETGCLISCLTDETGSYTEIYKDNNELIGIIEGFVNGDDGSQIVVGGKIYETASNIGDITSDCKIGEKRLFFLNKTGKIAAVSEMKNMTFKWAYLDALAQSEGGLESGFKLKIFGSDNLFAEIECADKLLVDGAVIKTFDAQKAALTPYIGSLIMYKTSEGGEISQIETADGTLFTEFYTNSGNIQYDGNSGTLKGKVALSSQTLVFAIPSDGDESKYSCKAKGLSHEYQYKGVRAYRKIGENYVNAEAMIVLSDDNFAFSNNSPIMFVEEISMTINSDGESVYKVSGLEGKVQKSYICESGVDLKSVPAYSGSAVYEIEKGDMISYVLNSSNEIVKVMIGYKSKTDTICAGSNPTSSNFNQGLRFMLGTAYKMDGQTLLLAMKDDLSNITEGVHTECNVVNSSCVVYVYDAGKDETRLGSVNEIITYAKGGDHASRIFSVMRNGLPKFLVILK